MTYSFKRRSSPNVYPVLSYPRTKGMTLGVSEQVPGASSRWGWGRGTGEKRPGWVGAGRVLTPVLVISGRPGFLDFGPPLLPFCSLCQMFRPVTPKPPPQCPHSGFLLPGPPGNWPSLGPEIAQLAEPALL